MVRLGRNSWTSMDSSILISLEILKDMDPAKIKPAVKDLKGLILYNLLFEIFSANSILKMQLK